MKLRGYFSQVADTAFSQNTTLQSYTQIRFQMMNNFFLIAAALAPVLMLLSASEVGAAETYNVDYLEIEECEYDQVATVFSNGWVFVCEDYQYPYHYGSAVLIVDHLGYGGARLCLSGSVCLKGRIE